jgi:hypothetical protein
VSPYDDPHVSAGEIADYLHSLTPMPTTPNPETHCTTCGEPLSTYGHCWQHHYPPMDPKQDANATAQPTPPNG